MTDFPTNIPPAAVDAATTALGAVGHKIDDFALAVDERLGLLQEALGTVTASGGGFGSPTMFDPANTTWSDGAWLEIMWPSNPDFGGGDGAHWTFGFAGDGLPWCQYSIVRNAMFRAAESQVQAADAANITFSDIIYDTRINTDGTGDRLGQLRFVTDLATNFDYSVTDTASKLLLKGVAGQTDPLLDLQDSASVHVFAIAPDGSVGGVAPSVGDSIKWDGTKWAATA